MEGFTQTAISNDGFRLEEQQRSAFTFCKFEVTSDPTSDAESDDGKEFQFSTYSFLTDELKYFCTCGCGKPHH